MNIINRYTLAKKGYRLSQSQYFQLCKLCDQVISRNLNNKGVIGQEFLHMPRYSPLMSKTYLIFYRGVISNIAFNILSVVRGVVFLIASIYKRVFRFRSNVLNCESKVDWLFISHYSGELNRKYDQDSYFGQVVDKIAGDSKVLIAYINHTSSENFHLGKGGEHYPKVLLQDSVSLFRLFEIYKDAILSFLRFNSEEVERNPVSRNILLRARFGVFSAGSIRTQIISRSISDLVKEFKPKSLITTYEGHAWERLSCNYVRQVHESIVRVAYQHAPIFECQHAAKRGIGGSYDPDIICTSGTVSQKQLMKYNELGNSKISLLGSSRFSGCRAIINQSALNTCLVAPEGNILECLILFNFSLECATKLKDVTFVWRLPPGISKEALFKKYPALSNSRGNIIISNASQREDFKKSSHILYRGSSIVIQAVLSGLRPIYLSMKQEPSMDPLFLYGGDWKVEDCENFERQVRSSDIVSEEVQTYCEQLYTEINTKSLQEIFRKPY